MAGHFALQTWILIIILGGLSTFFIFLFSSVICFFCVHPKGTLKYLFKTLAIGLLTIPVAIILLCLLIFYVFRNIIYLSFWRRTTQPAMKHHDVKTPTPDVMIYLINGTFDENPLWVQPGSALRKEIEALGLNVDITHFSWDGQNTITSRTRASIILGEKLAKSSARHHYLIAHSHGSAVVREMSHRRPDVAHKVRGVCLLSPPFIYRCQIERTSGALFYLTDIGGSFALQLVLAAVLLPFGIYDFFGAAVLFCLTALAERAISKHCRNSLHKEVEERKNQESVNFNNVQIFQAVGDEADSALRFVSSLHESCFAVLAQLKDASRPDAKFLCASAVLSYFIYAAVGTTLWYFYPNIRDIAAVCGVGFIAIAVVHLWQLFKPSEYIPNVLITAALPVTIFSFWLGVAKALAYGDLRLMFCPNMFISSSETPAGEFSIHKYVPKDDAAMLHSTHSHPQAIRDVTAWISNSEYERTSTNTDQLPVD
ncbi:hypothetical protein [Dickeya sp. ws52]|uniref:hypothetical protein n=1 Tax=Dickeya sp. ws52 TaxID=2576377 RepID=UPI00118098F4|nr:hypothetical protein [Dickeya sp. ws52]TYL42058.1 hypothetical protein FDP13_14505 [Dickeya sp. ws52]